MLGRNWLDYDIVTLGVLVIGLDEHLNKSAGTGTPARRAKKAVPSWVGIALWTGTARHAVRQSKMRIFVTCITFSDSEPTTLCMADETQSCSSNNAIRWA